MIKSKPAFSVVTVCFNDGANLEKTAVSVLEQKDASFEWVVVDGASKDGTVDFLKDLQQRDNRLRWISEPDRGIYEAFNKGIELSRNDYVVFICAGDLFCGPETLREVTAFIEKNPGADLYYGDAFEVDQSGKKFFRKARSHTTIWWGIFTHHQSMFYARTCFDRLIYDESYRIGGDYALTAELLHSRPPAMQMPFPTARFLLGGTSHKNFWLGERENWICRRKLGTSIPVCAAIFAAHAVIRFGRMHTPGLYRALRYSTQPLRSALRASSSSVDPREASEAEFSGALRSSPSSRRKKDQPKYRSRESSPQTSRKAQFPG